MDGSGEHHMTNQAQKDKYHISLIGRIEINKNNMKVEVQGASAAKPEDLSSS